MMSVSRLMKLQSRAKISFRMFNSRYSTSFPCSHSNVVRDGTDTVIPAKDQNALKIDAQQIFEHAVHSVQPKDMIQKALQRQGDKLYVHGSEYEMSKNVYIVGFGKAVLGMIRATENLLKDHVVKGLASIPIGQQETFRKHGKYEFLLESNSVVKLYEGAKNNIPDEAAHEAAIQIQQLCLSLTAEDILIVLMSGGGSALLPAPIPPITLHEKANVTKLLAKNGATIQALNTVRKNLSCLKGGGLAKTAAPAKVISLMLSDIIGDPMELIASGPTVADPSTANQCLDIFRMLNIDDQVPGSVMKYLRKKAKDEDNHSSMNVKGAQFCQNNELNNRLEQPSRRDNDMQHVRNMIIGSNKIAVEAAADCANKLGYMPFLLTSELSGEASVTGTMLARLAKFAALCHSNKNNDGNKDLIKCEMDLLPVGLTKCVIKQVSVAVSEAVSSDRPLCFIAGGETTVSIRGKGKGGRNQELALSAAIELNHIFNTHLFDNYGVQLLSAGTDGIDGPTDAAGAFADPSIYSKASIEGIEADGFLKANDSYNFYAKFKTGEHHYIINHTGTNVMDLQILLVYPYHCPKH